MNFHYSLIKCRNTSNSRNSTFQDMLLKKLDTTHFSKRKTIHETSTSRNNQILYSYLDLAPQPPLR